jgi:hypothetical protein
MFKRFYYKTRKPFWSRFVSCTALGFYLFALIVMPALHWHAFGHGAVASSEHSADFDTVPTSDSEETCPMCQFVCLAIPFFVVSDPLPQPTDTIAEVCSTLPTLLVVDATDLPPCRAPPISCS